MRIGGITCLDGYFCVFRVDSVWNFSEGVISLIQYNAGGVMVCFVFSNPRGCLK